MYSFCIYLQVHQPFRVNNHLNPSDRYFGIKNKEIFNKVAKNSYLPVNKILLNLLKEHSDFKLVLSFSGTILEQMEKFSPETLRSFQHLHDTGKVEILSETYHHSLAFFYSKKEFEKQVRMHKNKIRKLFGVNPKIFRNTELSYNNDLAKWAENKGYKGILTEGWNKYLNNRSPNFLYRPKGVKKIKVLLRNHELSDSISFLFSDRSWSLWPLSPKKFIDQIVDNSEARKIINLFMDYETFGEHHSKETGIFDFLKNLPTEIFKKGWDFKTASELIEIFDVEDELDIPKILTWADTERDLSAWVGNSLQKSSLKKIYDLEKSVLETKNRGLIENWRKLQTSDHFYYMCTKTDNDGGVHAYFSPFNSPKESHTSYMKALNNLKSKIAKKTKISLPYPV